MKILFSYSYKLILVCAITMLMAAKGTVTAQAQETFQQKLVQLGFNKEKCVDWSDSTNITIPKPTCAYVNLTGVTTVPKKWSVTNSIWMEVYDGFGNYFKKRINMKLQGRSSQRWEKRNFKVEFFNDEWIGDDTPEVTIGDWVEQDAFHFKAFYLDFFKGTGIIGYKIYDQITRDRGEYGRIWERAENIKKPDLAARCFPDAFPCIVYFDGKFYGVYTWQLKKHRKNMTMKKHTPEHVYVDGTRLDATTLFGGSIVWSRLEVRNPKDLYSMTGKVYDRDNSDELIDETSPYYDLSTDTEEVKKYKQTTAQAKKYIINLSNYGKEIQALINRKESSATIRAAIEERFDVTSVIDYIIHNMLTNNFDGLLQNFQWFTYDGKKWFVAPYDLDATFGNFPVNFVILPAQYFYLAPVSSWTFTQYQPLNWVYQYYKNDINQRYAYLRDNGLINAETITSMFYDWYYSVGEANYANEWKKWPNSPCIKETIANTQWELLPYNYNTYKVTADYNSTTTYNAGDICKSEFRLWKAKKIVTGVRPYKQVGCKDSLQRIANWTKQRMVSVDSWMNYSFTSQLVSHTLTITSVGWSTVCLPFKFSIPEGIEIYSVKGCGADGQLIKERVMDTEAYKPYLVKGAPGDYVLTGYSEKANENAAGYLVNGCMQGCLVGTYVPQGCYVLQNHNGKFGFYKVAKNGSVKIGNNKAYLSLGNNSSTNIILFDEETPTTYASVSEQNPEITGIYNIDGMEMQSLSKGINVIKYSNGKTVKLVVK